MESSYHQVMTWSPQGMQLYLGLALVFFSRMLGTRQ